MIKSDNEEKNKIKTIRQTRFINGSKYEGAWDMINKTDVGKYITSHKVILEGEFRNGLLHSHGSICWPRGQIMDGVWDRGHIKYKRYTFSDGLSYCENKWDYCIFPDRRFYHCIINGLKPAGRTLNTNIQPAKIIPPFCYDIGTGIFDPDSNYVISYSNCKKILEIPTTTENTWIMENCRKNWSKPIGHQVWLHEYWLSGAGEFADLPLISLDNGMENWWQRLTKLGRYLSIDALDKNNYTVTITKEL